METLPPREPQESESGAGPTAAIVIVVILLVLGGLYFLVTQEMKLHAAPLPGDEQVNA